MRIVIVFLALALIAGACAAPSTPTAAPTAAATGTPSPTPATLIPILSSTPQPTVTAPPTFTPVPVLTFTPIVLFIVPSPTASPSTAWDCSLLTQSVANGSEFEPGERFTVGWQLLNTGGATWYPGSVQFVYFGGTKMYIYPLVQLRQSVPSGAMTSFSVDMRAPKNSTTYTTLWSLRQGDSYFCRVRVSIFVK